MRRFILHCRLEGREGRGGETDSNEGSADLGRDCHKLNKWGTCALIVQCVGPRAGERGVQLSVALRPGLLFVDDVLFPSSVTVSNSDGE